MSLPTGLLRDQLVKHTPALHLIILALGAGEGDKHRDSSELLPKQL